MYVEIDTPDIDTAVVGVLKYALVDSKNPEIVDKNMTDI
tara:strand:+ start:315 stop:431 length:117 start_codon:yes stop_codon:yes gene_type:complete